MVDWDEFTYMKTMKINIYLHEMVDFYGFDVGKYTIYWIFWITPLKFNSE